MAVRAHSSFMISNNSPVSAIVQVVHISGIVGKWYTRDWEKAIRRRFDLNTIGNPG